VYVIRGRKSAPGQAGSTQIHSNGRVDVRPGGDSGQPLMLRHALFVLFWATATRFSGEVAARLTRRIHHTACH